MPPASVVLVHGAWHGAWCWSTVVDGLTAAGVPAVAVDLPGHGDDPSPLTDLHGDARRVYERLEEGDGPVVLVGHSYGGAVITEAGVHPRVRHLVYIAAFNLDEGESVSAAAPDDPDAKALDHSDRPDPARYLVPHPDQTLGIVWGGGRILFFDDCPDDVAVAAEMRLDRQPAATLQQSPALIAWKERPSTYAVCTEDRVMHPGLQRILARRAGRTVEWPTGHSPFLSRPELVVELLTGIADEAGRLR